MSDWTVNDDALVRLGKKWIRRSTVVAVEPASASDGSLVHLTSGATIRVVTMEPDTVVERLFKGAL